VLIGKDAILNILNSQNNKTKLGSVFCNLQKAFDTINHDLLMDKLQYYGIGGKANKLIESYLQKRYQSPNYYTKFK